MEELGAPISCQWTANSIIADRVGDAVDTSRHASLINPPVLLHLLLVKAHIGGTPDVSRRVSTGTSHQPEE